MSEDVLNIYELKSLEDLGKYLNYERKRRGIEIEEVQKDTKIRTRYIHAIERGEFSLIPGGDVYIRGFLKNYAEGIGLDSQQILEQYRNIIRAVPDKDEISEEEPEEKNSQISASVPRRSIRIAIMALIALAAILLLVRITKMPKKDVEMPKQGPESQIDENNLIDEPEKKARINDDEMEEVKPVTVEMVEETREKTTYSIEAQKIEVKIKVLSRCWISAQVNGHNDFEGILNNGDTKSFEADGDIIIRIGNPLMVELMVNEVDMGVPGGNARDFIFLRK